MWFVRTSLWRIVRKHVAKEVWIRVRTTGPWLVSVVSPIWRVKTGELTRGVTGSSIQPVMFSKTLFWALRGGVNSFHIKEVLNCHKSLNILRHHHCLVLPQGITQSPDFFFRQVGNLLEVTYFIVWYLNIAFYFVSISEFSALFLNFGASEMSRDPLPPIYIFRNIRPIGAQCVSFHEF